MGGGGIGSKTGSFERTYFLKDPLLWKFLGHLLNIALLKTSKKHLALADLNFTNHKLNRKSISHNLSSAYYLIKI